MKSIEHDNDGWFTELYNDRQSFVEISRKNDFEHGIWQSTVDKYAEPDHFVYELLQNAEDQEATEVTFELQKERLIFCHNGDPSGIGNLFSRDDVRNITGIGNSNKPEQANKIGRFGIGFKSVFVITERPEIYSRLDNKPFAFAIENLVVPIALDVQEPDSGQKLTRFVLPFRADRASEMHTIIEAKLRSLGSDTLLFLEHLTSIAWKTEAENGTYLCQRDWKPGTAWETGRCVLAGEAVLSGTNNYDEKTYLLFNKLASVEGADRKLTARIAFRLEKDVIIPEPDMPAVNVYFPTEERVGLKFRLHAPFLLTDNRANIKSQERVNHELVEVCAELLSESLPQLRDMGLLSVSCLNCLPIQETQFSGSIFLPLYQATRDTLKTEKLIPILNGGFARAEQVRIPETANLRSLLNSKQLSELFESDSEMCWLSSEITEAEETLVLRRYLQYVIGVGAFATASLADKFELPFIEKQSDEWLVTFYGFLTELPSLWRAKSWYLAGPLREKPFIRLADGNHVKPFKADGLAPNVFLPPDDETQFPIVNRTIAQDEKALRFFKELGLDYPDMADEVVELILPLYNSNHPEVTEDVYRKHIEQISKALASPSEEKRKRLQDGLKETYFIKAVNAADPSEIAWMKPIRREVFYSTIDTKAWFEGNEAIWFVDGELEQSLFWHNIAPSLGLTSQVPTWRHNPYAHSSHGAHTRGLNLFDPTAETTGMDYAISHMTPLRAKTLWKHLLTNGHLIGGIIETATRQDFTNSKKEHQWSIMGKQCRNNGWMPTGTGTFHKPSELFLSDLPEEFEKDTVRARILADQLGMKKPELQQLAEKLGVTVEDIEIIQKNPDSFKRWMEREKEAEAKAAQPSAQNPSGTGSNQDTSTGSKSTASSTSHTSQAGNGSESQRTRLLSYVLPKGEATTPDKDKDAATSDNRENINRAGVDRVLAWETQAGRYPTEMSHTHPGYDVESRNEAGEVVRYIEVKSRTGAWDQQGVTLSDTQFHEAQNRGEAYWLYIVENADQDDAHIFRIQDPANHVEYFCFDNGWGGLSE